MIRLAKTKNGTVRGIEAADPRITSFKGIPFAAPPVGENRWRAPQPVQDWEGVMECFRFRPIAVQDTPGIGDIIYNREWHVDTEIEMSEDCLYLNVWTGAKAADEKQPVLLWFFGGGLQWGYPSEMEFDGERLARRGIVVVSVNYRLGVFGFLAHPEISAAQPGAPTNFGNLDQQAGLNWVIENIAAFGGDPENITIAGQSAGGGSVMSQMACPANRGRFQKAIVESAMIRNPYGGRGIGFPKPLKEAEKNGEAFFNFIGAENLAQAREMPALYIRDKYSEYAETHDRFFTAEDGIFCVGDPITLFQQNKRNIVPVMAGNTSDEFPNTVAAASEEEYRAKTKEIFGDKADEFLSFAEARRKLSEKEYAPVNGIECTAKKLFLKNEELNGAANCYYYRFDCEIPGWDHPGNFHSVDLWFFFETLAKCWRPFTGKYYDLSRQMCNYWANFVKSGNPNGPDIDGSPMPEWRPYTEETPDSMVFNENGIYIQKEESKFIQFLSANMAEE